MSKKRIAVIFGGKSSEHEVSRVSASYVLSVIPRDRYEVVTIGITKQGKWLLYSGDPQAIADGRWEQDPNNVLAIEYMLSSEKSEINCITRRREPTKRSLPCMKMIPGHSRLPPSIPMSRSF